MNKVMRTMAVAAVSSIALMSGTASASTNKPRLSAAPAHMAVCNMETIHGSGLRPVVYVG